MSERIHVKEREISVGDLAQHARERREANEKRLEQSIENTPELSAESARHEIEQIHDKEKAHHEQEKVIEKAPSPAPTRKKKVSRDASFKAQMKEVDKQLPPVSRAFSHVIHNKAIEKVSEGIGSTVARPNAILSAAVFGFVLTSLVYLIARHYGYPLSGFETIGAMIIGWLIGIIYDFVRIMITGKN